MLLRPVRKGEARRAGQHLLRPLRQVIELVNWTFKGAMSSLGTGTGQFLGTPDYSAPEQIEGRTVDGRTDQYALACVAYQLLTGAVPFERDQGMAVLLAQLSAPPPSAVSRRPGLPGAADEVLAKAMAKAPEKRYRSCTTGGYVGSRPAVAGSTVYVGNNDGQVYALDAATGHPRWTYTTGGNVGSSPAVAGDTVYVGSQDNNVYALSAGS